MNESKHTVIGAFAQIRLAVTASVPCDIPSSLISIVMAYVGNMIQGIHDRVMFTPFHIRHHLTFDSTNGRFIGLDAKDGLVLSDIHDKNSPLVRRELKVSCRPNICVLAESRYALWHRELRRIMIYDQKLSEKVSIRPKGQVLCVVAHPNRRQLIYLEHRTYRDGGGCCRWVVYGYQTLQRPTTETKSAILHAASLDLDVCLNHVKKLVMPSMLGITIRTTRYSTFKQVVEGLSQGQFSATDMFYAFRRNIDLALMGGKFKQRRSLPETKSSWTMATATTHDLMLFDQTDAARVWRLNLDNGQWKSWPSPGYRVMDAAVREPYVYVYPYYQHYGSHIMVLDLETMQRVSVVKETEGILRMSDNGQELYRYCHDKRELTVII